MKVTLPIPPNEADRLKALKCYGIIDVSFDERYEKLLELAKIICDVPSAFISLIDDKKRLIKVTYGIKLKNSLRKIKKFYIKQHQKILYILLNHSTVENKELLNEFKNEKIDQTLLKPLKIVEIFDALSKLPELNRSINKDLQSQNYEILIVEDNPVNMILIKYMLLHLFPNGSITKKVNGKEALTYCNKNTPDIIFMDLLMPVMNGFEASTKIRSLSNCQKIPIIAVSSGNINDFKEKSAQSGFTDFIAKPFNDIDLSKSVNKWLNGAIDNTTIKTEKSESINVSSNNVFKMERLQNFTTYDPEIVLELFEVAKTDLAKTCKKLMNHEKK